MICFLVTCIGFAQDLEGPPVWVYSLAKINTIGFSDCKSVLDFVVTGKKSSVVFAYDYKSATDSYDLASYKLNKRGRAAAKNTLLSGVGKGWLRASAVWFESGGSAPPPKQPGHGLLFLGYCNDNLKKAATFAVAKFDADGKLTSGFTVLHEVSAPANSTVYYIYLRAEQGPTGSAAAFSYSFLEDSPTFWGVRSSKAFFVETDVNGLSAAAAASPPAVREIVLPESGNLKELEPFRPAWNGKRWLVPARLTRNKLGYSGGRGRSDLIGEDALVIAVRSGSSSLKPNKLFSHNDSTSWGAYYLYFLPRADGGSAPAGKIGDPLQMLYIFRQEIPDEQQKLQRYNYTHRLITVNGKAKQVGSTIIVQFPQWHHKLNYDPDARLLGGDESLSSPIQADSGESLFVQCYTLRRSYYSSPVSTAATTYQHESEFNLLSVNPTSGQVTLLATGQPNLNYYLGTSVLGLQRGRILAITSGSAYTSSGSSYFNHFFSWF